LEKIRQTIKEAAPESREKISYQMPTITLDGRLLHFAASKNHIGLYGASGAVEAFKDDLAPYANAKGALRFPLDKPMPFALIREIVKFRAKENAQKARKDRANVVEMTDNSTRITQHIHAPRAKVYRALVDANAIAKWKVPMGMTCYVHAFDARVGG